jgi:hypothetical protein
MVRKEIEIGYPPLRGEVSVDEIPQSQHTAIIQPSTTERTHYILKERIRLDRRCIQNKIRRNLKERCPGAYPVLVANPPLAV